MMEEIVDEDALTNRQLHNRSEISRILHLPISLGQSFESCRRFWTRSTASLILIA